MLRVSGLTVRYRKGIGLTDLSVELAPGVHAVVGANGAGKSTLLAALGGAIRAGVSGAATLEDRDLMTRRGRRGRVVYQPQRADLPARATVRDCLDYAGWLYRIPTAERRRRAGALAVRFLLDPSAPVGELSGGTVARVALAQSWMPDVPLLLLDEPVAGVDFEHRAIVREEIASRGREAVVLMATHHHDDIGAVVDQVLLLDAGRLIHVGASNRFLDLGDGDVERAILALRDGAGP